LKRKPDRRTCGAAAHAAALHPSEVVILTGEDGTVYERGRSLAGNTLHGRQRFDEPPEPVCFVRPVGLLSAARFGL
jgi:hypothetical protein